ncbi:MAG: hypothetical protein NC098_01550 [Lachnoclostridium sp.]|nr:hypothetical protein [Lachnoclostridium sp.]
MKNYIKSLFVAAALCFSMTACDDEVGLPDNGTPSNPEKEVVGVYEGTWTETISGAVSAEKEGTVTLGENRQYLVDVTADCTDFFRVGGEYSSLPANLSVLEAVANISHTSIGYAYTNTLETNGFNAQFYGVVKDNKTCTLSFRVKQKVGRKENIYDYTFTGTLKK